MTSATTPLSEDTCEIPISSRHLVIPRRHPTVVPLPAADPIAPDPEALTAHQTWLTAHSADIDIIIGTAETDPDLAKALDTSTPLAAAVNAALAITPATAAYPNPAAIIDAWLTAHDLPFATAATVELFGITVSGSVSGARQVPPHLRRDRDRSSLDLFADLRFAIAARLRHFLAAASDADYALAREVLTAYHSELPARDLATIQQRALMGFLMPEHTDWVDANLASFPVNRGDHLSHWLLICSLTTEEQAADFPAAYCSWWWMSQRPHVLWTAVAGVGSGVLPCLATWLTQASDSDSVQLMLGIIGCLPSEAAFQFLVDGIDKKHFPAATIAAAGRFPRRALRILAEAAVRSAGTPRGLAIANVLRIQVLAHNELARSESLVLGPAARTVLDQALAANTRRPEAAPDSLPALFTAPPWLKAAQTGTKPTVIKNLTAPTGATLAWREGERESWDTTPIPANPGWNLESWAEIADRIRDTGSAHWYADSQFAAEASEDLVRSVLPAWQPDTWRAETWVRHLVLRLGADALPPVLHLARRQPAPFAELLAPFAAPEAALLAADWLTRSKTARPFALAWLDRHPDVAANTLIPVALGKPGKARAAAEVALRALAASDHADQVAAAAAGYGPAPAQAVAALVADDGTLGLPRVMPPLPSWADPRVLPQILLKDGEHALPEQSVTHLLSMLAISTPAEAYPGVRLAKEICDPSSLANFGWLLFENWRAADHPPKDSWAFETLRWFGDDGTVRRLAPMIRLWPGENGHHRAVAGLDILAAIGGDAALTQLYGISQKAKFKGLKERAARRVTEIADGLGLSAEQLGDRLVPELGLDRAGTLVLDYGARTFTVGFDEQLKPFVADAAGKRLKALPKPGAKDDAVLAPAAHQLFSGLKKDVRTVAGDQISRFELAMVTQRRWTAGEFTDYFVAHPLLRHLVRRLVWATFDEDGRPADTFRVAEDGTLAGIADDEYHLAATAVIGIPHPLHLGTALATWSDLFADYELLQPFPQLGRATAALTDAEKAATNLTRFLAADVPVGRLLGLERRGWRRGTPQDGGVQRWIYRTLPHGGSISIGLDPGIVVGWVLGLGETQQLNAVFIDPGTEGGDFVPQYATYQPFSVLDDVAASELLRDLTEVTAR
ncbi:DUF4132 domain-containing protein [Catenulispora yoronensis]